MAKKEDKTAEETDAPKKSKLSAIAKLLGPLGKVLSIVSILLLFGGVYTLGFIDLRPTLFPLGPYFIYALIFSLPLALFLGNKSAAHSLDVDGENVGTKNKILEKKIGTLESKVNKIFVGHYDVIKEENEKYKAELDALEQEKSEKVVSELEELRQRNTELQEQLNNMISLGAAAPSMTTPAASEIDFMNNIPDDSGISAGIMTAPPNDPADLNE